MPAKLKLPIQQLISRYKAGETAKAIAASLNCTGTTILRRLREAGIKKLEPVERFWSFVDKNGPVPAHRPELGRCWVWTGATVNQGYGTFNVGGRSVSAHRFAYALYHGSIPEKCVCHKCDNRKCCRKSHLFSATNQRNMDDAVAKGRTALGVKHGRAKLVEAQIPEIRRRRAEGESCKSIGKSFGVSDTAIRAIFHRKNWKHVRKERKQFAKTLFGFEGVKSR